MARPFYGWLDPRPAATTNPARSELRQTLQRQARTVAAAAQVAAAKGHVELADMLRDLEQDLHKEADGV